MVGIIHPEDLVINDGSLGAKHAVNELINIASDMSTLTIKWDGFPAIVFGRDNTGNLVFVDKHMFKQVALGKLEKFTSIKEHDLNRNVDRSDLWKKEEILRPALEQIIPKITDTYYMGDLLWVNNKSYIFKPNTVEYHVKPDSELGSAMNNSLGGIAVHTYIPSLTSEDEPITNFSGFSECKDITFIVSKMNNCPKITLNATLILNVQNAIALHASGVDAMLTALTNLKCKSVITAMSPFITSMIDEGDISNNIAPRFNEFVVPRLTDNVKSKILKSNGKFHKNIDRGLVGLWSIWSAISNLKLDIKKQIDNYQQYSDCTPYINNLISHEGYVYGSGKNKIKLVNRTEFSRANFNKYKISLDEIETKSKMPMAAFCFGRMNPPTLGHKKVVETTIKEGGEHSFIFASCSCDDKRNPLDHATKIEFLKKIHPSVAEFIISNTVQTPLAAANWLYDQGYRHMTFIAGSDRLGPGNNSIETALNYWNSGPTRTADYARGPNGREFVVLKFVSSGERESSNPNDNNISGTLARQYAKIGDKINFQLATGVSDNITVSGKSLYQATREGMNHME